MSLSNMDDLFILMCLAIFIIVYVGFILIPFLFAKRAHQRAQREFENHRENTFKCELNRFTRLENLKRDGRNIWSPSEYVYSDYTEFPYLTDQQKEFLIDLQDKIFERNRYAHNDYESDSCISWYTYVHYK